MGCKLKLVSVWALVQPYKGYSIDGRANLIHPFNPLSYPGGTVLKSGRLGSIIQVARLELRFFYMEDDLAWFGLQLAALFVDEVFDGSLTANTSLLVGRRS